MEVIRILLIEHYVMVLKLMDILLTLVYNHVLNINILLFKMVMEKLDGVLVITI